MLMLKSFLRFSFSTTKDAGFKVFVSNLDFKTSDDELRRHMSEGVGTVLSTNIFKDKIGRQKGFGLVEYSSKEEVQKAIDTLNDSVFYGRKLRIQENVERSERGERPEGTSRPEYREKRENLGEGVPTEKPQQEKLPGFKISLKNLSFEVSEKELVEKFSEFGKVIKANTYKNFDGKSTGKGYAIFESKEDAEKAISNMNKSSYFGRTLIVHFANQE